MEWYEMFNTDFPSFKNATFMNPKSDAFLNNTFIVKTQIDYKLTKNPV